MRQQDKVILWPIYFDSTKTRAEGRKVPKELAVSMPKISETKEAADKLRLSAELVADASYPRMPSTRSGMLLVKKNETKTKILKKIAKQLIKIRSAAQSGSLLR